MGFKKTQDALIDAILLPNTPVIALHGLWGTGKTHLWHNVADKLEEKTTITHLYISCTAYGTIAALKSAVITMLLSRVSSLAKHGDRLFKTLVGLFNTKLPKDFQLSANLLDIQVLLPRLKGVLPTNCLVAFDDIERATELDIRELLGFVSFLNDQLNVRVLLILNKEKLGQRQAAWDQLREKIISIEIALQTEPSDCISIGIGGMPSTHFDVFADRVRRLGITNIRILQHMRRVYNALEAARKINDEQWVQIIPSIVLFVALHFNVLDNAPTVEQMLEGPRETKDMTEVQVKALRKIEDYKLGLPDDFEFSVLVPYLRTGHLNAEALSNYMSDIQSRRRRQEVELTILDLFTRYHWDVEISNEGLLSSIEKLRPHLDAISDRRVTELSEFSKILGNPELGNALISDWIKAHRVEINTRDMTDMNKYGFRLSQHLGKIHPDLQAVYNARYTEKYPPLSLQEAIEYLYRNRSWGDRQSDPVENASPEEIEGLIRTSTPDVRMVVFEFFADHLTGRVQGGPFRSSARRFASVCRAIVGREPTSRLSDLIKSKFTRAGIASILEESPNMGESISESDEPR